jgi:uncharacterized RDD family membrane protein YckC
MAPEDAPVKGGSTSPQLMGRSMVPAQEYAYATPLERLIAHLMDVLIVIALTLTLRVVSGDPNEATVLDAVALPLLVSFVYFTGFMVTSQSTPGKLAYGLRIIRQDGSPPEPMLFVVRYVVYFLTLAVPLAPLISGGLIWFKPDRRAIHDRFARTVVVRMPSPQK